MSRVKFIGEVAAEVDLEFGFLFFYFFAYGVASIGDDIFYFANFYPNSLFYCYLPGPFF